MRQPTDSRRRQLHVAAGQDGVESVFEVSPLRLVVRVADAELIVDQSPIADDASGVEHEDFRSSRCAEPIGHLVAGVLANGKRDPVELREVCDLGQRILLVGIDAEESNVLAAILFRQLRQSGMRSARQGGTVPTKTMTVAGLCFHPAMASAPRQSASAATSTRLPTGADGASGLAERSRLTMSDEQAIGDIGWLPFWIRSRQSYNCRVERATPALWRPALADAPADASGADSLTPVAQSSYWEAGREAILVYIPGKSHSLAKENPMRFKCVLACAAVCDDGNRPTG